MELVISAHKSVAELGVLGRAEDMHDIMDAERDATLAHRLPGSRRRRSARNQRTRPILAVDPGAGTLLARMDDGRTQPFGREETTAERLALGYAVTIHRSQAATVETAHRYEDGGGRELAYVGMSRARASSHVYVVADDLDQAAEDLVRDWSAERRPRWAIDTGTPTPGLAPSRNTASIPPESDCAWPACGRSERRSSPPSHPTPARSCAASSRSWPSFAKPSGTSSRAGSQTRARPKVKRLEP